MNLRERQQTLRKLLDYADLQERGVKYSKAQLWRLWKAGKFPKPIKISPARNSWLESDIDAWIEARIRASQPEAA